MTTGIEWTDVTWNPATGCDKVSPGCDHCYAERMAKRLAGRYGYPADEPFRVTLHPDRLDQPLTWRKSRRVFVNSMSDLFHPDIEPVFVADVFAVMAVARQHTYQVLTKRPQRMAALLGAEIFRGTVDAGMTGATGGYAHLETDDVGWPLPNVWLGTSIENDRYTFRADHLRATPAAVRFLSLEPLLGPLPSLNLDGIDWVIVGGESGPGARPMHPDWVRDIRDRCVADGVPFFFKQWGEWFPVEAVYVDDHDDVLLDGYDDDEVVSFNRTGQVEMKLPRAGGAVGHQPNPAGAPWWMADVGKKHAGRELDGRTWDDYPS